MGNNILEPIPATLNGTLQKYDSVTLSNTTPAATGGATNVTWAQDQFGNISASVPAGGGGVTAISVATANGVSGTSSGGTTPALTLALGAITPTTVTLDTTSNSGLKLINQGTAANFWNMEVDASGGLFLNLNGFGEVLNFNNGGLIIASLAFKANAGLTVNGGALTLQAPVTATSATAGAASALPATPLGYVEIVIAGTTVKIPYYSV